MTNTDPIQSALSRIIVLFFAMVLSTSASMAQNSAHPEAKSPLKENPYLKHRDPWRWDVNAQLFLNSANVVSDDIRTGGRNYSERVTTVLWSPSGLELVYPVVREGGFYWSPNKSVEVDIRLDDFEILDYQSRGRRTSTSKPSSPLSQKDAPVIQKYVQGTYAEYTIWNSGQIDGTYRQLHLKHNSHIVCADTVFNDDLARNLPWPDSWEPETAAYLTPIVDSIAGPVNQEAQGRVKKLLEFWVGENDPKNAPQLDIVKFLTGKVIEYFTVQGQSTEFTARTTSGGRPSFVVSTNTWGGFLARSADEVALDPRGSKHDMATLLTAVLRSAGVPARTVICVDPEIEDKLENVVSLVEFAMHDPERDQTFWVPIDVDRVRLNGGRSSQFKRKWLYFGSHDELNHLIPIAYFFHPPAKYQAYDLPLLYGIRSSNGSNDDLPRYMIQGLLIEPIVSPATGRRRP